MTKRLNGWQRLWVLVSLVWLVATAAVTFFVLPKASDYRADRVTGSLDAVGHYLERTNPDFHYEGAWTTRTTYYANLSDDELVNAPTTVFSAITTIGNQIQAQTPKNTTQKQ